MKKLLTLVLALAMLLSVCAFSASAEELVDGKFAETKHITVEVFQRPNDGNSDPTNNPYANYIKEKMLEKYNVEVEFVAIGRWTEVDDMNTALASGDAPDVCVTYSYPTIAKYAQMGGIVNLNDIQEVNKNRVIMDAETYLPIGDMYKEGFQAYLDTKFLGKQ